MKRLGGMNLSLFFAILSEVSVLWMFSPVSQSQSRKTDDSPNLFWSSTSFESLRRPRAFGSLWMLLLVRSREFKFVKLRMPIGICEHPTSLMASSLRVLGNPFVANPARSVMTSLVTLSIAATFVALLKQSSFPLALGSTSLDDCGHNCDFIAFRKAFSWIGSALI